jgi:cobalt-precorrin-5B (C1)-methyltransferase
MTALRTGITTGTCASTAAKAAAVLLLSGNRPESVDVPLPGGGRIEVPLHDCRMEGSAARAVVVKDSGDDPDVTDGQEIHAVVSFADTGQADVIIRGGTGVGTVTLPGLPVAVGNPAINPVPHEQILASVREVLAEQETQGLAITIEVPEGERLAKATMNPRLGITGGISILGTQGIVKPYSHDSWKASIREALDVARATGVLVPVFTTGRRSEKYHLMHHPDTSEQALVQAADFFAFSMQEAALRSFQEVWWAVFPGKLVKQAQGLEYTHAKTHPVDFGLLADHCREAGVPADMLGAIEGANTARQVFDMLKGSDAFPALLESLARRATDNARRFAGSAIRVRYAVYDFDASLLLSR